MIYDDCLLRKVAVRVCSGEEHGSGWIVPSIVEGAILLPDRQALR